MLWASARLIAAPQPHPGRRQHTNSRTERLDFSGRMSLVQSAGVVVKNISFLCFRLRIAPTLDITVPIIHTTFPHL